MEDAKKFLTMALDLPQRERAEIAVRLLESLDEAEQDEELDDAWIREIERRCRALDSGEETTVSWEELRAEIDRDILKK